MTPIFPCEVWKLLTSSSQQQIKHHSGFLFPTHTLHLTFSPVQNITPPERSSIRLQAALLQGEKKKSLPLPSKKSHFVQPDVLQNGTAAVLEGGRASHPGGARWGGGSPRPAPGGAEANGRWGGGGRLLPPSPPYIAPGQRRRPVRRAVRAVPSRAEPSRARMPGRTVWRLALLALCLGAAAAGGHRRGAGGKSRRQAQTQTTSLPQGTAAQGKREYRPRAGHGRARSWARQRRWSRGALSVPFARPWPPLGSAGPARVWAPRPVPPGCCPR